MLNLPAIFAPAERDDERLAFVADPSELYPAAIAHVRRIVEQELLPNHPALEQLYLQAKALPAEAWDLALLDKDNVEEALYEIRAAALEIARQWATELLHQLIGGGPMAIKIPKDLRFRL